MMGVTLVENPNLAIYQLNGVAQAWYNHQKEDGGIDVGLVDWDKLVAIFLDRFFPPKLREPKLRIC